MSFDAYHEAAEAALRELEEDEGNWPTGEQVDVIIEAVLKAAGVRR